MFKMASSLWVIAMCVRHVELPLLENMQHTGVGKSRFTVVSTQNIVYSFKVCLSLASRLQECINNEGQQVHSATVTFF
jgi:hypothetical protein